MDRTFPYASDARFAPFLLASRIGPGPHGVTVTGDGRLVARFGFLHLETALSNVDGAHLAGPYRWWTAVGPRLSFVDDGLTFGTTDRGGVCIHFRERVHHVLGRKDHSALTVTVADREGLVQALTA